MGIRIVLLGILGMFSLVKCQGQGSQALRPEKVIKGKVVYGASYLPEARVALFYNDQLLAKQTADSNGDFMFTRLLLGSYVLKVVTTYNDQLFSNRIRLLNASNEDTTYVDEFKLAPPKQLVKYAQKHKRCVDTALNKNIDSIVVYKSIREMAVYHGTLLLKWYPIQLGFEPVGKKHFKGDGKTPEGKYFISMKKAASICHKALLISYPNKEDRDYAHKHNKETGGDVEIHGLVNGEEQNAAAYIDEDWTFGCIAVNNFQIDELYQFVVPKCAIQILP